MSSEPGQHVIWQFQTSKGWMPFSDQHQAAIEEHSQNGRTTFDLIIKNVTYKIDLKAMKQVNTVDLTKTRNIRKFQPSRPSTESRDYVLPRAVNLLNNRPQTQQQQQPILSQTPPKSTTSVKKEEADFKTKLDTLLQHRFTQINLTLQDLIVGVFIFVVFLLLRKLPIIAAAVAFASWIAYRNYF